MKVIWLPQANKEMRKAARYIRKEFGHSGQQKFMKEVRDTSRLIGNNPNIGIVEPLLADRPVMYRSFVMNRLNKIIYTINDDSIEVADFWDVRRDPGTLASQVK